MLPASSELEQGAARSESHAPHILQGVLSQTFKLVVTYDGKPNAGVPTEFIAKFLNPDPVSYIVNWLN